MLVLFDIDATLVSTCGAGIRAMEDAARDLFGPAAAADGIEYAGRLDPLIIADFCRAAGRLPTREMLAQFRERYRLALARRLRDPGVEPRPLPGVLDLLRRLRFESSARLGLLTGNFEETGSLKLAACGIDPARFDLAVWGDHSPRDPPDRADLPPVAMRRFSALAGCAVEARHVTIIGDTPHDVRCARAHGCRSLGVATGRFSVAALLDAGADAAVPDLSDTAAIVAWLAPPPR